MKKIKIILLAIIIILVNFGCDQGTKNYAREHIKGQGVIQIVGDIFILQYAENNGGFLSVFSDIPQPIKTILLIIIPVIALVLSLIYVILKKLSYLEIILICCILGGGISNIYDRIVFDGWVTDFLNFGIGNLRTGILNFADISVFFGGIFLGIVIFRKNRKLKNTEQELNE